MNESQSLFTIFFAIFFGTIANVQPRWKAFNWAVPLKTTRNRIILSCVLFNIVEIVFFACVLWILAGPSTRADQWTAQTAFRAVFFGVLPAFATFGFYRVWMALIELKPDWFYARTQDDLPDEYRRVEKTNWVIEPSLDLLGILEGMWRRNMIVGLTYIFLASAPLLVR